MVRQTRKDLVRALDLDMLSKKYGEDAADIVEARRRHGRKWRSHLRAAHRAEARGKQSDKDLVKTSVLAKGSVQKRYVTCGRPKCPCMAEGKKHGPYWYLSLPVPARRSHGEGPTMVHFYLTQEEAAFYGERIRRFRELQDQIWDDLWSELSRA